MKHILPIVFSTLILNTSNAQTFSKRYESAPDINAVGVGVVERGNQYYFLDQAGNLTKVDNFGASQWSTQTAEISDAGSLYMYGENLCLLGDGNILKAGNINLNLSPSDPLINFSLIGWAKVQTTPSPTYLLKNWFTLNNNLGGLPLAGIVKDVSRTADGGAIIACDYKLPLQPVQGNLRPMFIKMDINANYQWIKSFSTPLIFNSAEVNVIEQCVDSEFICAGNELDPFGVGNAAWVSKADLITGLTSWTQTFQYQPVFGNCALKISDVIELSNGNFAVLLNDACEGGQIIILNNLGFVVYHKKYSVINNGSEVILFQSIVEGNNSKLLITGANQFEDHNLIFLSVNLSDGSINESWQYLETSNLSKNNSIFSLDQNVLVSTSSFDNLPAGTLTKSLIKMDQTGFVDNICRIPLFLEVEDIKNVEYIHSNFIPGIIDESAQYTFFNSNPQTNIVDFDTDCCNISIELTDFNVKCGPPYTLTAPDNFESYYWNTGETTQDIEIKPGNTYTVTVVDANGCVGTATYNFELPLFDNLEITGAVKKCCDQQFFFAPAGFETYIWTMDPTSHGTINSPNSQITEINWSNLSDNTTIYVECRINGCIVTFSYVVQGCCPDPVPSGQIYYSTDFCAPSLLSDLIFNGNLPPAGLTNEPDYLIINNDLIIDVDYLIKDCPNILVENNHKILVEPGVQFTIDNSNLNAKCNYMWDGIFVNDPLSLVNITNGAIIEQAKNAVVSDNGGNLTITGSLFRNNYIGVKVNTFGAAHAGQINSTIFNSITGALLSPYNQPGTRMHTGIELNQVNQITIGSTTGQNLFNNTDYGIYDTESDLISINNRFTNLILPSAACTTCDCPIGTGICAIGSKLNPINVTVGGSTADANIFKKVNHGIDVHKGVSLTASYNNIDDAETGIRFADNIFTSADINYNFIKKFKIGIISSNNTFTPVRITYNDLNTGFSLPLNAVSNTGIYVFNNFQQQTNANIHHNEIKKARNGIFIRNARWTLPWPISFLRVEENTINFGAVPNTTLQFHYGIRLEETDNAYINHNFVDKQNNNNPNANVVPRLRGISLLNSRGNTVTKNVITKLGAGIRAYGNCMGSTFECNVLTTNYYGFQFDGPAGTASINTDQAPGGRATGNMWTTLGGSVDIFGGIFPTINWYYATTTPIPSTNLVSLSLSNNNNPIVTSLNSRCSLFTVQGPIDERENRLGGIVRDEFLFPNYQDEFKAGNKKMAFTLLKENPSMLNLGAPDDSLYQQFYQDCNLNCIGKFKLTEEYITNLDFFNADLELQQLNANNSWDDNLKQVYRIIIESQNQVKNIDSLSISELENYAWLNATIAGPSSINARALLNLDIEEQGNGTIRNVFNNENEEQVAADSLMQIYPNPANDYVLINISNTEGKSYSIQLLDVSGKVVATQKTQSSILEFDVSILSSGMYYLQLSLGNTILENKKLIISR